MNKLYKYIFTALAVSLFVSCDKTKQNDEKTVEFVSLEFSGDSRAADSNTGDLIGVSMNHYSYTGNTSYVGFGQYKIDENGAIKTNGDEFIVRWGQYIVMYSGVKASSGLTKVPPHQAYNNKCYVYDVHRDGADDAGNEDVYIGIPDINFLYFSGNSLQYNTSSPTYAKYILDADIELKQQYSQIHFTVASNKEASTDGGSAVSGHVIKEIGLKNLIKQAKICPIHGLHINTETDMDNADIKLLYDTENTTGEVLVTDRKTLLHSDDLTDGYVNILSGDYSEKDASTSEAVLPSPVIYVTYANSNLFSEELTNNLPIMVDLEPQTRYQFDLTLTNTQINIKISKVSGWINGDDQDHTITELTSYSVDINNDNWEIVPEIGGSV